MLLEFVAEGKEPMNAFKNLFVGFGIFVWMLGLAACSSTSQPKPETVSTEMPSAYPPIAEELLDKQGYPEPETEQTADLITIVPTPVNDNTTVTGYISILVNNQPKTKVLLALAEIIVSPDGKPMVAGFDRTTAPRTLTDANGRFVFTAVKPGHYALIVDLISDAYMLTEPNTGNDFIIIAEPGKIIDLGELIYNNIPGFTENTP